jgi:hypothetical protein
MNAVAKLLAALAGTIAATMPVGVAAQAWPTKPVRLVAVFPPGGSVDQVARVLGHQLTLQTGQQFIVDNRGGASGSIGTAAVAKADPDGYTLAVVFDTHAVNPSLIPNLPFDTVRDLTPIMLVGTGAMALVTPAAFVRLRVRGRGWKPGLHRFLRPSAVCTRGDDWEAAVVVQGTGPSLRNCDRRRETRLLLDLRIVLHFRNESRGEADVRARRKLRKTDLDLS